VSALLDDGDVDKVMRDGIVREHAFHDGSAFLLVSAWNAVTKMEAVASVLVIAPFYPPAPQPPIPHLAGSRA